ncbi:MAG: Asp-tRNA(Asn)/Glu-tRNA(Gln) amidotransferase subunit GatA [Pseudomonadota bacterium]
MIESSLKELSKALADKKISSVELTQLYLDRMASLNHSLNAFITPTPEFALEVARRADEYRAKNNGHRLLGIPMANKDNLLINGQRTTCGSRMLGDFIAPYTSHVVESILSAGMVPLGKLNMDEFAMGSSNQTSYFGVVRNPWDLTRVPGGSSGGSAAAVSARLSPIATASDTGGSIRQPASFTNTCGLKPTYGLVSRYGVIAFASSLDQVGALGRSVEDVALFMEVIAGHDSRDSTSLSQPVASYVAALETLANTSHSGGRSLEGLRIGLPKEMFVEKGIDAPIWAALEEAKATFSRLGATLIPISLPHISHSVAVYYVIAPAEAFSNLARYDGVRYGYRTPEYADLQEMYTKSRAEGFGEEVKRRIMIGTYMLTEESFNIYYIQAQKVRRLITDDFNRVFTECDVLLGPSTPITAFEIGSVAMEDPLQMYLNDIFTIPANLTGMPALSIPCGFTEQGLPIGMQLMGPLLSEELLFKVGHAYQQVTQWHQQAPNISVQH